MKKKIFLIIAILSLFPFVYFKFIKRTKGFSVKKITSYHDYQSDWDLGPLTDEQKDLLERVSSQPFTYLGSGKECYAFVSEDRQLVLKFFKQKHMDTRSILSIWPLKDAPYLHSIYEEKVQRRKHLRNQTFMSYIIGYTRLADRTGLLYLHLNKAKNINRKVTLISPKGGRLSLDLDSMEFLIQRRADLSFDYLDNLLSENKIKEAKQAIGSILDLIITRSKRGIFDFDNNCEKNIGFIDGRAALIDVGEFRLMPPKSPSAHELNSATDDLDMWLSQKNPDLQKFLKTQIQKKGRHDL